jgi:magnesium-transporting ATPase (P-type)
MVKVEDILLFLVGAFVAYMTYLIFTGKGIRGDSDQNYILAMIGTIVITWASVWFISIGHDNRQRLDRSKYWLLGLVVGIALCLLFV